MATRVAWAERVQRWERTETRSRATFEERVQLDNPSVSCSRAPMPFAVALRLARRRSRAESGSYQTVGKFLWGNRHREPSHGAGAFGTHRDIYGEHMSK